MTKRLRQNIVQTFTLGISLGVLIVGVWGISVASSAEGYDASKPQFHMYPDPEASSYKLKRLGPVGIGLDLRRPDFTMHITQVEKGAPAEACGKLRKGQIIESINGQVRVYAGNEAPGNHDAGIEPEFLSSSNLIVRIPC